ncbi:MAG: ferrochelatase [Puniceicoccaceae bacterium]
MKIRTFAWCMATALLLTPLGGSTLEAKAFKSKLSRTIADRYAPEVQLPPQASDVARAAVNKPKDNNRIPRVALMYVGHGEPATAEDGDIPIVFPDGSEFGPHGVELDVPAMFQHTEWAAAYEEIATALAYIFGDINGNGIIHEVAIVPHGDVPGFFSWEAFHGLIYMHYAATGNYSPHNDSIQDHVDSLDIKVHGAKVDVFLALLDEVPRIPDVVYEIAQGDYDELVVIPMLVAKSTHTDEITGQMEEVEHLTHGMDVMVAEPFFEVPYMRKSLRDAIVSMTWYLSEFIPEEVEDHNIGVVLASHGTPYVPPYPEFGWQEGEIYSELIPTEDAFHEEIAMSLPWASKTGRMNYSTPEIGDALADFEYEGYTHVVVVPSAFPTAAIHTMYDVANPAVGRPVLPQEGVVTQVRASGMTVYYTSTGIADLEPGRELFRDGLAFLAKIAIMEALEKTAPHMYGESHYNPPGVLSVVLDATVPVEDDLKLMLYDLSAGMWPDDFAGLPMPDWMVTVPQPVPESFPARLRIPLEGNIMPLSGKPIEGVHLGLAVLSSADMVADPDDPRGFSSHTAVYSMETGLDFGRVELGLPIIGPSCESGTICVTVHAEEVTGPDLKLMLYKTTEEDWPQGYLTLPTPTAVVTQTVPVPAEFPIDIHIPIEGNLFTFSGEELIGERLGLVVVTGVAANFVVEPTDARGFSAGTLIFDPAQAADFGALDLFIPQGNPSDINPYHPHRLTGPLLWEEHMLGEDNFVPGAIYLDVYDLDGDGVKDIIMVGEPHFEEPGLPLEVLKLGVYYMNADMTVKSTEILDSWSEGDPLFYSPWGVKVIEHSGAPMIIVGCNIPELAPLEEGSGVVLSYKQEGDLWVRSVVRHNPDPTVTNYNAMIVVASDIDNDGDEDLALSGAFQTSSVGSWLENTGIPLVPWVEHLQPMDPATDPHIRGTLAYKSADLNNDGYPEIIYNAMFDIPDTNPPRYRGEIWLAINPGPGHWGDPWPMVVIDDDNWAAADMWFHDFDGDGFKDLIANQIFNSTVTRYWNPGGVLTDPWAQEVIIDDLTSPSDMWLADMDQDGQMDVCSADHTAHRGFWHQNPGHGEPPPWKPNLIFRNIRLPGDFAMQDMDDDGDDDWVGTTMTFGKAFIMEQVHPEGSLVVDISLPEGFTGNKSKLLVTLAHSLPVMGPPAAVLAEISNADGDGDGIGDIDNILSDSKNLVLAFPDTGLTGDYHVVVALYMEGGGVFQPVPGIDYMAASGPLSLGSGQATTTLVLEVAPPM